ncbi:MAG TPA: patatin-like phospholipase family protein [Flavobacterium sp.]|jgi:NTE family protein
MKNTTLVILLICSFWVAMSQELAKDKPLKIGLVLSGGGAKGLAHIGVLKVIEEAGIKIDYIGGTSMGAVIGGLYASGYTAKQIDSVFNATNFDELLRDFIPRSYKNFYEKKNDEMYAVSLPFEKFRIGVPTSFSKGAYLYSLLNKLTYKVRHVKDFNKLPTPFLCIATNVETGEEVLLNEGYLAQAILASATFPTLFSPVEINGKLMVDGGVSNNYPIDEVRKLGADVIIGVDVQDGLKDRNALRDATRILVQITNLQMIEEMIKKKEQTDVYIKPNIKEYSVISFSSGDSIIKKGEEASYAVIDQLKKLGTGYKKKQMVKSVPDTLQFADINLNELKNYTRSYVLGKLQFETNTKITYDDLKTGIDNLNVTGNFSAINYTIEKCDEKNDILNLSIVENPNKTYLKFGLHYDGLYKSALLINMTQKKLFLKNDILSLDLGLGDNFRYNLDYYVDNGFHFSFGYKSRLNQFNRNIYSINGELFDFGVNSLNIDFLDFTNQVYLQTVFVQKFLIGGGLETKYLKIRSNTLSGSDAVFDDNDYLSVFGYLKYDSFDDKYFPTKGWFFNAELQSFLYSSDTFGDFKRFSIAKGEASIARTFYRIATVKLSSEAGLSFGGRNTPSFDFILGGYGFNQINNFQPFYGYNFLSLEGNSYIKSTGTIDVEFYRNHHINLSANYANIGDDLFLTKDWISTPKHSGYAIGYALESIIGPIEFKYSWSPEQSKGFTWLSIGFRF